MGARTCLQAQIGGGYTSAMRSVSKHSFTKLYSCAGHGRALSSGYIAMHYKYVENVVELRRPYRQAHLQHWKQLVDSGHLLLAGAYDPADGALFIFNGVSKDTLERLAMSDPYHEAERRVEHEDLHLAGIPCLEKRNWRSSDEFHVCYCELHEASFGRCRMTAADAWMIQPFASTVVLLNFTLVCEGSPPSDRRRFDFVTKQVSQREVWRRCDLPFALANTDAFSDTEGTGIVFKCWHCQSSQSTFRAEDASN
eukprot:5787984-Pleurochrysis_carterae.AAC.9